MGASSMERAYSQLQIKAVDAAKRTFSGMASTPSVDRGGDIVEPKGVSFKNPVALLLYHDSRQPIGEAKFGKPTKDGIPFEATIPSIADPGPLKDRVDEAWGSITSKPPLLKGLSIGYKIQPGGAKYIPETGGLHLTDIEVFELSLVAVPMNAECTITAIKSLDRDCPADGGQLEQLRKQLAGDSAPLPVVKATSGHGAMKKSFSEQISAFEATRQAKSAERAALMEKAADTGETLDATAKEKYDGLSTEIKAIDEHLVRLRELEEEDKKSAKPAAGSTAAAASDSRVAQHTVSVKSTLEPGIEFARMVICKAVAFVNQGSVSPMDVAKSWFPDNPRIQKYLQKAAVPPALTTNGTWAGDLIDPTNLTSEFLEFLRKDTIIDKFGQGNIPALRRLPFNIRINGQTGGGSANWVGQGKPKPLTAFGFNAQTLLWAKIAAIAAFTEETFRFSSPSIETLVRDSLRDVVVERMNIDFIHPSKSAVANVSPASITNGLTPLSSAGTSADNVRTDLGRLLREFLNYNMKVAGLVLIMPNTLALTLSLMRNALGAKEFPDITVNGGFLEGIPVITSEHAANESGAGNLVIAVNARFIGFADDGEVSVDASREASLEMSDAPTQNGAAGTGASMVSLWQNNMMALRAERFVNWGVLKTGAVHYMDDVNWGSVGSPE